MYFPVAKKTGSQRVRELTAAVHPGLLPRIQHRVKGVESRPEGQLAGISTLGCRVFPRSREVLNEMVSPSVLPSDRFSALSKLQIWIQKVRARNGSKPSPREIYSLSNQSRTSFFWQVQI